MTARPENRILCCKGRVSAVLDNEKGIMPHERMTRDNGPACRVPGSLQGRQERKQGLCCGHRLLYGRHPVLFWKAAERSYRDVPGVGLTGTPSPQITHPCKTLLAKDDPGGNE